MSTNPFARVRRANNQRPFTFGRTLRPTPPIHNFPNHPAPAHQHPPPVQYQGNRIPRAPHHSPNPFRPMPPPTPTATAAADADAAYVRTQTSAYKCGCAVRLYADHAEMCAGPAGFTSAAATAVPLGWAGNAGSAVASVPPFVWLLAAAAAVGRAIVVWMVASALAVLGAVGSVLEWVLEWVVFTLGPWVLSLMVGLVLLAVVAGVVWWVCSVALNVYSHLRRPADYYVLKKNLAFLGNVTPLGASAPLPVAALSVKEWLPVETKALGSYVGPKVLGSIVEPKALGTVCRTVHFGTPAYNLQTGLFLGYNTAGTETAIATSLFPRFPVAATL